MKNNASLWLAFLQAAGIPWRAQLRIVPILACSRLLAVLLIPAMPRLASNVTGRGIASARRRLVPPYSLKERAKGKSPPQATALGRGRVRYYWTRNRLYRCGAGGASPFLGLFQPPRPPLLLCGSRLPASTSAPKIFQNSSIPSKIPTFPAISHSPSRIDTPAPRP